MGMFICCKCNNYANSDDGCNSGEEYGYKDTSLICTDCVDNYINWRD